MRTRAIRYILPLTSIVLVGLFACQDSVSVPEPIMPDTPEPSGYSGWLPVLFINTEQRQSITSKDEYLSAQWWLDNMSIEGYESIGSASEPLRMQIKGQGNYTWEKFPKKSYRLKLETKQMLMGMKKNRHFVLLAFYDDYLGCLKNTMAFELSRHFGLAYTPAQEPVEVVLNGQYIGLYFLTEKIRVGKNRVNIIEQHEGETDFSTIATGGWLLEIDNHPNDNCIKIAEHIGGTLPDDSLTITYHSPEHLSPQQQQYLTDWITRVNTAIYTPDKSSTEWEQFIDIDSLAIYYIVGEIMDDIEYFSGSCYMYRQQGEGMKLIFGPVWDFGNAYHRWAIYQDISFKYFLYEQPTVFTSHWIEEITRFPHFQQVIREQWRKLYASEFNGLDIDRFADEFVEHIKPAVNADYVLWPKYDIEVQKNDFKLFIHRKINWLNDQWGEPED